MRKKTLGLMTCGMIAIAALTGCAGESTPEETSTTSAPATAAETEAPETTAPETASPGGEASQPGTIDGAIVIPPCDVLADTAVIAEQYPEATEQEPPSVDEFLALIGATDAAQGVACLWELPTADGGLGVLAAELDPAEAQAALESLAETGWTETTAYGAVTARTFTDSGSTGTILVDGSLLLYVFSSGSPEVHAEFVTHAYDAVLDASE